MRKTWWRCEHYYKNNKARAFDARFFIHHTHDATTHIHRSPSPSHSLAHINTLFSPSKLLLLVALLLLVGHALCERGLVCLLRLALRLDRLEFRLLNRRVNLLVL